MDFVKVEHSLPSKSGRYLCVVNNEWMDFFYFDEYIKVFSDIKYGIDERRITHWAEIVFPK